MRRLLAAVALLATVVPALAGPCGDGAIPPLHDDAGPFEAAIAHEADYPVSPSRLSGVTVPHHLVAGHLIARGLKAASGVAYGRVILLSPDHLRRYRHAATTARELDTVFGPVPTDGDAVRQLVDGGLELTCDLSTEHGVQAVLPFIRHYLPDARIVPVVISSRSERADWDRIAVALAPLVDDETLVVQSTDFSHYHPAGAARRFDQSVLNVIASGSLDLVAGLMQPDHLDSAGSMYVQMKLQHAVHGARPVAIASANQQQFATSRLAETTGYIVLLFGRFSGDDIMHEPGAELVYLAGDTHLARAMVPALSDEDAAERVVDAVLALTRGKPLVVNLEGVILPNVPDGLPHLTLAMPQELAIDMMRRLNVVGAGLANNHAMDLGQAGHAETLAALDEGGIALFGQGERFDIGSLSLVGLTDIESNGPPFSDLLDDTLLERLAIEDGSRNVVAFVHWGREYEPRPGPREVDLAERMRLAGASLIVGAHPHVASQELTALAGGEALMAYSLGNFMFDQSAATSNGKLLEVRLFEQGTWFARLVDLPNLFDIAATGSR